MVKKILFVLILGTTLMLISSCEKRDSVADKENHSHQHEDVYTCPMHPEIRENKPGNCPICHMKLVKVEKQQEKANEQTVSADLDISPYQANLIGVKPITVEKKSANYSVPVSGRMLSKSSVAMQVYEKDLQYIKRGSSFQGHNEIHPERVLKGEITSVDNLVDPTSRTVRVVGVIKGQPSLALLESSFSGQIFTDLGEQIVVPEKAILFTGKGPFVYVYHQDTLHPKPVVLGPKVSESYVVSDGLNEGDKISSGPNFLIDSESKIRGLDDQKHH